MRWVLRPADSLPFLLPEVARLHVTIAPNGLRVGRTLVPHLLVSRIVSLKAQGYGRQQICRKVRLSRSLVVGVLSYQDRAERILSGLLLGSSPCSRIARSTQHPTMLAGHRGPDGRIVWETVPGYDERTDLIAAAVAEAIHGPAAKAA